MGAANARGEATAPLRMQLDGVTRSLEEFVAAEPHLTVALAEAKKAAQANAQHIARSRLDQLADERRGISRHIDKTVDRLAELLAVGTQAATECQRLHRQLGDPGADGLVSKRSTALIHNLTARLSDLTKEAVPLNTIPTYDGPFADVENVLLAEES